MRALAIALTLLSLGSAAHGRTYGSPKLSGRGAALAPSRAGDDRVDGVEEADSAVRSEVAAAAVVSADGDASAAVATAAAPVNMARYCQRGGLQPVATACRYAQVMTDDATNIHRQCASTSAAGMHHYTRGLHLNTRWRAEPFFGRLLTAACTAMLVACIQTRAGVPSRFGAPAHGGMHRYALGLHSNARWRVEPFLGRPRTAACTGQGYAHSWHGCSQ